MKLSQMVNQKSLQMQYITDEAGKRKAVILPQSQFEELMINVAKLAKLAENHDKSSSQSQPITPQKNVAQVANEDLSELQLGLLKQQYELLNGMLEDLQYYKGLKTDLERQIHLQRVITNREAELKEVKNQLGEVKKQIKPASLYRVPELPSRLVTNASLFNEIKKNLLAEATDKQKPAIVLKAPSGTGKSVMAAALARDADIRQEFPDGIFWHRLGSEADLLAHQIALFHALGETPTDIFDLEDGTKRLNELLAARACLLILDDVSDTQDVLAFNVHGEHCQLLITTSDSNLLEFLQYFISTAKAYEVKSFTQKQQAIEFFVDCVDRKDINAGTETLNLEGLVQACDYLPLALQLIASVARSQPLSKWDELLSRLKSDDYEFPEKYPRALMQTLHLNVEALGEQGDYYLTLAVFGDYSRIPQSVVLMLWRYLYQLADDQAIAFIDELSKKGLLEVSEISKKIYLSLHTFQHEYLLAESELDKLHNHLLAAYRRQCDQHGWVSGPNDGYFFEFLCMHLYQANRHKELKLLLADFVWMQKKLQATSIYGLLNDYEWLEDKTLDLIKKTLYEAALVLVNDKAELANQLLDRLKVNKSLQNNKDIDELLNQAEEASPNWKWRPHFSEEDKKKI